MITTPCGSAASLSLGSSSSWASLSSLAKGVGANSTNSREPGSRMKRRELSAAPSAVCPAAGGRTSTWLQETPPGPPRHLTRLPTQPLARGHLQRPPPQPRLSDTLTAQTSNKTQFSFLITLAAAAAPSLLPQALSNPLLGLSMATPTQSPTNVPEETDPFFYDYATVQTVGMTLATIMFVLGILIILSKKVKCRKADSSPTCKSCKSELPSSAPGGGGV